MEGILQKTDRSAVPGSCEPQHEVSTPFGSLSVEAVSTPVKEMTLVMSLAPGPAACKEQLLECSISAALLGHRLGEF